MAQRSDPNNAEPKLRILEWDSGFFGLRIARADEATLSCEGAEQLRESARREGIDCVYLLARGDDAPTAHAVEAAGFRPPETS